MQYVFLGYSGEHLCCAGPWTMSDGGALSILMVTRWVLPNILEHFPFFKKNWTFSGQDSKYMDSL